jgi:molybdopterin-guanine dinucleotide biosynthesis protein A
LAADAVPDAEQPPDAVILAGGHAARLGGMDKPGLVVGERSLVASVLSAACAAGARRVVVVGPDRAGLRVASGELRMVREDPPGGGPVPALRRGLAEVTAARVFLLAADLPFLRAGHLGSLRAAAEARGTGAVLADETGQPQWLIGCWPVPALRDAVGGYQGGSLRGLLGPLEPALLGPAPGRPGSARSARSAPPPWLDCDTPEDVRLARAWSNVPADDRETPAGDDEREVRR